MLARESEISKNGLPYLCQDVPWLINILPLPTIPHENRGVCIIFPCLLGLQFFQHIYIILFSHLLKGSFTWTPRPPSGYCLCYLFSPVSASLASPCRFFSGCSTIFTIGYPWYELIWVRLLVPNVSTNSEQGKKIPLPWAYISKTLSLWSEAPYRGRSEVDLPHVIVGIIIMLTSGSYAFIAASDDARIEHHTNPPSAPSISHLLPSVGCILNICKWDRPYFRQQDQPMFSRAYTNCGATQLPYSFICPYFLSEGIPCQYWPASWGRKGFLA